MVRIGKSLQERQQIEQMREAVKRYAGPVTFCRPGIARGHQTLAALATLAPNHANRAAKQSAEAHEHGLLKHQVRRPFFMWPLIETTA